MMLAFMGLIATYFFPHRYVKLGILGSLCLGFVLVFIGMIVGAKYVIHLYKFSIKMAMIQLHQHGGLK